MQIVQLPSLCIIQHSPDRIRACAPSLLPTCSALRVTAPVLITPCRTILQTGRRRRRGASCCLGSATPLSDLSAIGQALQLVRSLAEDIDSLKQKPLPSTCSLLIYRLTKLCTTSHGTGVALALTLDSRRHDGKGVFLHMIQLLQQDQDASSQNLAADLIQALFSNDCIAFEHRSANSLTLPVLHHSFDCNPLVELITSSNKPKVKTSAVQVLLLIAAAGSDGHRQVSESGAAAVTLLEMLSVANSWPACSAQQLPEQPSAPAGLHTLSEADPMHNIPLEITASSPFRAACSTLLWRLVYSPLQEIADGSIPAVSALHEIIDTGNLVDTLNVVTMAFAVSTCNWQPAQQSPSKPTLPRKAMQWWRRCTLMYGWYWLVGRTLFTLDCNPHMSTSRMLWLVDSVRKQQQVARDMIEDSEAGGMEDIIKGVTKAVIQVDNNNKRHHVVFGPQGQRDALVRLIMPSLLALLQHPVEARRVFAAETASLLDAASSTVVSALLSSSNGLSTLLTRLSGDDTPKARSSYATLIACCVARCNAAGLKKISDSGAVPYLLKLLREVDGWVPQYHVVRCLENLAKASKEMMTSVVVHGGTQQLLDLVHAGVQKGNDGRVQLHEETQAVTRASIAALSHMLRKPAAAADIIKADLAGLVLQIMQGPSLQASHVEVLKFLLRLSCQPAGRQQLLKQLTPDSAGIIIDMCLKYLEAPEFNEATLGVATALLEMAGEVTAGRQYLAVPSVASRIAAVLNHTPTPDSPGYSQAQGYVLPTLASLSYLNRDGTYYPNPWFVWPTPASQAADSRPPQTSDQASSEAHPEQPSAVASAWLSQQSTAELAHATPAGTAGQQTHSLPEPSVEELEDHQQWQEYLVQSAAALVSHSPFPASRLQAMTWLHKLVPQLTGLGCRAVASSGAVAASFQAIKRESEAVEIRRAALWFCVGLRQRGALPAAVLLEAGMHHHLVQLVFQSEDTAEMGEPAGTLLSALWQAEPQLVSEFVSQGHLPALLTRAAHMGGSSAQNCLVVLTLVHRVCTCTASLVSEPLLLQAIPGIVECCQKHAEADRPHAAARVLQLQANLQEKAGSLLCSMAEFPFYRPAIRKADPAGALTNLLEAGCSPNDGEQQRSIAQLALNLVYKLLQGQMDESDGVDAPYNHSFLEGLILHRHAAMSVMRMYKQGTIESRPVALAVLKLFLIHRQRPVHLHSMQQGLISLGLMPLLFEITQAPDSTEEMRATADECLASVHSDQNSCMAAYGTHGLIVRLIAISLLEQRSGTHPDRHGR